MSTAVTPRMSAQPAQSTCVRYAPPKPGESLNFRNCQIVNRSPNEDMKKRVDAYNEDVARLEQRYKSATALQQVDIVEVALVELIKERDKRREAVLIAMQDVYRMCEDGIALCGELSTAWREQQQKLQSQDEKVRQAATKELRKIYKDEPDLSFRGKVNTHPKVVKNTTEIREALSRVGECGGNGKRIEDLRDSLKSELEQLADYYRE